MENATPPNGWIKTVKIRLEMAKGNLKFPALPEVVI